MAPNGALSHDNCLKILERSLEARKHVSQNSLKSMFENTRNLIENLGANVSFSIPEDSRWIFRAVPLCHVIRYF